MSNRRSAEATIAGYLYQFDKSIIEVLKLNSDNDKIIIEGIEDIDIESIDSNSKSIQVKYYEGSEYNHSVISEAVRHLLDNYIDYLNGEVEHREYYLYGHYKSGTEKLNVDDNYIIQGGEAESALDFVKEKFLTFKENGKKIVYYEEEKIQYVDEDGGNVTRCITDKELEDFISLLKIDLKAKSINEQYEEVLGLLEEKIDNCKCKEEAEKYYYNNALKVVFEVAQSRHEESLKIEEEIQNLTSDKKSIEGKIKRRELKQNSPEIKKELQQLQDEYHDVLTKIEEGRQKVYDLNKEIRTITKKEFIQKIDQKVFLFNKWYAARLGRIKYNEYIKNTLYKRKSLNSTKNKFLILGREFESSLLSHENTSIDTFIKRVIEDSYEIGTAFANKDKPWTIVLDTDPNTFKSVIESLSKNSIKFNSGGEEYSFNINDFNEKPIVNANKDATLSRASYQIRIISLNTFKDNLSSIKDIDVAIFFMKDGYSGYLEGVNAKGVYSYVIDSLDGSTLNDVEFLFEKKETYNDYFRILTVSPTLLQIEVINPQKFKNLNENFTLGSYIKITDENDNAIIGILKSYKLKEINNKEDLSVKQIKDPSFILDVQPIGHISNGQFRKGNKSITIPPSRVEVASEELLRSIFYVENQNSEFCIGDLSQSPTFESESVKVIMNGNKFFNKHLAVVGSTGSGKSCTVAKILHEGIDPYTKEQKEGVLNNSHIVLFDLHGEYKNSFKNKCRYLEVDNLNLPYWLMNSEELEAYFLDAEGSDHNQRNIFKKAVTLNKKWHHLKEKDGERIINDNITYDSPVYFNIKEVLCCIENYNRAREKEGVYNWIDNNQDVKDIMPQNYAELESYSKLFKNRLEANNEKGTKQASLNFTNFISRLENKIHDNRLDFLLKKGNDSQLNLSEIIKQFIGYEIENNEKKNITIIDLSGMPFEVINIVVALVSRLIFKFAFERKKIIKNSSCNEIPFLLVYEEAHNYIPKSEELKYKSVREAVERIAKEGRKYGVSAMIVSQRPSEISETIFSQCNSFVVMRLTNPVDQNYIKKLIPEDISSITDNLSAFDKREALILGDAVKIPALVRIHELPNDQLPKSNDINFIEEWRHDWENIDEFDKIVGLMSNVLD